MIRRALRTDAALQNATRWRVSSRVPGRFVKRLSGSRKDGTMESVSLAQLQDETTGWCQAFLPQKAESLERQKMWCRTGESQTTHDEALSHDTMGCCGQTDAFTTNRQIPVDMLQPCAKANYRLRERRTVQTTIANNSALSSSSSHKQQQCHQIWTTVVVVSQEAAGESRPRSQER